MHTHVYRKWVEVKRASMVLIYTSLAICCTHAFRSSRVQFFMAEPSQVVFTDYQAGHAYQVRLHVYWNWAVLTCINQM